MNAVHRVASTSAAAALVLAALWLFWPAGLGGGTTYVVTHGDSMEPGFSTGDLAILSRLDSYSVGDVVAYRSESLDTIVMHRIVSMDADGIVTQGDNNDWLDEDRPTEDELLGRLFLRIPQGGKALDALRSPGVLLPLIGGGIAVLGATRDPRGHRTLRYLRAVRRRVSAVPVPVAPQASMSTRARARQVALGAAVVALLAAVGCSVLLALPTTQTDTRTLQVVQQGRFTYTGQAVAGTTYPSGVVRTGDTVWNRLVSDLTVSFTTAITAPEPAGVSGALRLDVVVSAPDGWSAVLATGAAVAVQDGTATASVAVDPDRAAELLGRHYEETGSTGASATLTVTPVVDMAGTVQGRTVALSPPAGLAFTLDAMSLRPGSTDQTVFAPTSQTPVRIEEVTPRTLQVLAASVPLEVARTITGAVLLLSLVAAGAGAWIGRIGREDGSDRFLVRHADRIVPVAAFDPGGTVIDVSDAESLHRVAERFDTLVLHQVGPDQDVFAVRDVDATYRFVLPVSGDRRRGMPPVPAPGAVPPVPGPGAVPPVPGPGVVPPVPAPRAASPETTAPPVIAASGPGNQALWRGVA